MSSDEPTTEGDGGGSEAERPAKTAMSGEMPTDAGKRSVPVPGEPSPALSEGGARSENMGPNQPDKESASSADESDPAEMETGPRPSTSDSDGQLLALERQRDGQGNIDTRLPAREAIAFRSVTLAEVYVGQAADVLTTTLGTIEWTNFRRPIVDDIAEARQSDYYAWGNFWLVSDTSRGAVRYGQTNLPSGIDHIYGNYYVLGRSLVALVLTFVLTDDEAKGIDTVLQDDAESRVERHGTYISIKTVRDVKQKRIRDVREEVAQRCLEWLKSRIPGTLLAAIEGLDPPTCTLISLAIGKPFDTQAEYMELLDLSRPLLAEKFIRHEFLYLVPADGGLVAAFNETDAVQAGWARDLSVTPETFHEEISSLMIADGLRAALLSFEPRLRDLRAGLNRLDIEKPAGTQVIRLRDRLLGLSLEISTLSGDVTVLVDETVKIWSEFSPLTWVFPNEGFSAVPETTAETKRRQLRKAMETLQAQEVDLRDLILVISQSMSETRNLELQTQVLGLTNGLSRLTRWLTVLTIVLVVLGVATLVVQLVNTPAGTSNGAPSSHATSPAASQSPRPQPAEAARR